LAAAEFALEVGCVEPGGECRPEAELFALGVERDARPSLAEGLLDGVERLAVFVRASEGSTTGSYLP